MALYETRFPLARASERHREIAERSMNRNYNATNYPSSRGCARNIRSCSSLERSRTRRSSVDLSLFLPLFPSPFLYPSSVGLSNRTSRYYTSYPRHQIAINPFCPALHNISRRLFLVLSFPLPLCSPTPSVYFQFSRYIRPRTIQDKTFSSPVLPAGSLNDRASPSESAPDSSCILASLCSGANDDTMTRRAYTCAKSLDSRREQGTRDVSHRRRHPRRVYMRWSRVRIRRNLVGNLGSRSPSVVEPT